MIDCAGHTPFFWSWWGLGCYMAGSFFKWLAKELWGFYKMVRADWRCQAALNKARLKHREGKL